MKLDLMASDLEIVMGFAGKIEFDWFAARFLRDHSEALALALRALRDAPVGSACNFIGNGPTHAVTSPVAFPDGTKLRLVPLDTTAGVG